MMMMDFTAQAAPVIWTVIGLTTYCVVTILYFAFPPRMILDHLRLARRRRRFRPLAVAR